jgi:hypothetical protein
MNKMLKNQKIRLNRPPKRGESKNARKARKGNKQSFDSLQKLFKQLARPLLSRAYPDSNVLNKIVSIKPLL